MKFDPFKLRQVSVFQNASDDDLKLIAEHAIERSIEEEGLTAVDREFYVMQSEIYTKEAFGSTGLLTEDTQAILNENPEYLVFNGAVGGLTDQKPLMAKVGETVRIFFGVGGPNFTSSFHVIGEIFDSVYDQASLTSPALTNV